MNKLNIKFLTILFAFLMITGCGTKKEEVEKNNSTSSNNTTQNQNDISNDNNDKNDNRNYNINFTKDEYIPSNKDYLNSINAILIEYGEKIYDDNSYFQFYVDSKGYYFISFDDLKDIFHFDMSKIVKENGESYNTSKSGIYIDPNNIFGIEYEKNQKPIVSSFIF